MSNLTILNNSIRQLDNLYSLTDLHRASGGEQKHKPVLFLSNQQTKELISEIEIEGKVGIPTSVVKTVRGGKNPSTYACEELMLAYAMWISPKFHLVVLRAFLNLHKKSIALPPAEERFTFDLTKEEISNLTLLLFSHGQMNWLLGKLVKPLEVIGSSYSPTVYGHHTEYKRYYDKSLPVARKLIEPLKQAHRADFEHLLYRLSAN